MKKKLLFSLIGAIVIFTWQFFSFAMPNFHKASSAYTPLQDSILQKLQNLGLKEGMYLLGQADPGLSMAEQEKQMNQYASKPWAVINYQEKMDMRMAMPMIRGLIICFIISFILFWFFQQQKDPTLTNRMLVSLGIGIIAFFYHPYTHFIWYKEPDIFAYLADGIVPWAILGFIGHKMAGAKA